MAQGYKDALQELHVSGSKQLSRAGQLGVHQSDFFYYTGQRTYQAGDLPKLEPGVRRMLLRKQLLRRLLVADGLRRGIYEDAQARAFLLPRIERALEEYYVEKMAKLPGQRLRTAATVPAVEVLRKLRSQNAALRKRKASVAALAKERDRLADRLAARRVLEARRQFLRDFLRRHPRLEVFE